MQRRILLVHAHPDDETINCGVTMARAVSEGDAVTLVTCTLGEEGEILVPDLAGLASDRGDGLGGYRLTELRSAMAALGVTDWRLLGGVGRYRDSGMRGAATNDDPRAFCQADLDEAAGLLAEIVLEVRPETVVTYDPDGGYGHPDHVQAHRVTMRAVELAAERGWRVPRVLWCAYPASELAAAVASTRTPPPPLLAADNVGQLPPGTADNLVTVAVTARDGSDDHERKVQAMRAHATQLVVAPPLYALSNLVATPLFATEWYRPADGWEPDATVGSLWPEGAQP
ncbi:MAG: N-acetyl-1-D-myo-inositol-2-amino-2-deoxy-alpha-D-glucopyranoside deacetylase [Actinomycetales bacterium]